MKKPTKITLNPAYVNAPYERTGYNPKSKKVYKVPDAAFPRRFLDPDGKVEVSPFIGE